MYIFYFNTHRQSVAVVPQRVNDVASHLDDVMLLVSFVRSLQIHKQLRSSHAERCQNRQHQQLREQ